MVGNYLLIIHFESQQKKKEKIHSSKRIEPEAEAQQSKFTNYTTQVIVIKRFSTLYYVYDFMLS